jgi:hypothetical protein
VINRVEHLYTLCEKRVEFNLPKSNAFGLLLSHISFPLLPPFRGYGRAWFVCDVTSPPAMDSDRGREGGVSL